MFKAVLAFVFILVVGLPLAAQDQSILQAPEAIERDQQVVDASSEVFGNHLFKGEFRRRSFTGFSPDYEVAVGDSVTISLWGAFTFAGELIVDAQGNILVPRVGPVRLLGVRNQDLNTVVQGAVNAVFKKNVNVYANLNGAKPVQVLVTGFVATAGVYAGQAADTVLYFLDSAGGIDPDRGSFRNIRVLRQGRELARVDLYAFIRSGHLPLFQMRNGDTIVVEPLQAQMSVSGEARNSYRFEYEGEVSLAHLLKDAAPNPGTTHARIERNSRVRNEVDYVQLADAANIMVSDGDKVSIATDKLAGTISVTVEGEHLSTQEFVMPYGATLADLMAKVETTADSDLQALQLLRNSLKVRQKEMLEAQLRALESSVLNARSISRNEAELRAREAELILQFLDRARDVEPRGQLTLANFSSLADVRLEPGDIIRVPRKSNVVMIHGDVLFPNAVAFQPGTTVEDYISQAGGLNGSKRRVRVLVLHRDGTFIKLKNKQLDDRLPLRPGDEIFVLPKVEVKTFQLVTDILEVLYRAALSAGVLLAI